MTSTDTNTADTTPAAAKVEVIKVGVPEAAAAIAAAVKGLEVRPTDSKTYRILGTVVDGDVNWKKGLIYVVNAGAKAIRLELQLYSPKKSAHLAEFKDRFNQFAGTVIDGQTVEQAAFGLATRLRIELPYALGVEGIAALGAKFLALVNAEVEAVRALITLAPKKEKKAKKVKAEKAEAPAQAKKAKSKTKVKKVAEVTAPLNPEVAAALADIQA